MVSRGAVVCIALLCTTFSVAAARATESGVGRSDGRNLLAYTYYDNAGVQHVAQTGINYADDNGQVNQANVNQAAQQVGDYGTAANNAAVTQTNSGRKLLGYNTGYQDVAQTGINYADDNGQVNQANVNQAAQQVGDYGTADNSAAVTQGNSGRKLSGSNTGYQYVDQLGANVAYDNGQANQANVNQAAQQVGDYGTADNSAAVTQGNSGRKLSGSNYGYQDVAQTGVNYADYNGQVNQANVNQAAQQVGDYGTADNSAAVTQGNSGRKLSGSNTGYQYVDQLGANVAYDNGQANQANVNQAAQQVGDYGTADNSAALTQGNSGRKLLGYNNGYQDVAQTGINYADNNGQVNQANVNQAAQQVGDYGTADNSAAVTQGNSGRKLSGSNTGYQYVDQLGANVAYDNGQVNQANVNQAAQQVGDYGTADNSAAVTQGNSGRKLSGSNYGSQDVAQSGVNYADDNGQVNQANVNQAAQQVGDYGTADNSAAITQENSGRKLFGLMVSAGRKLFGSNYGYQDVAQTGENVAYDNGQVNQANVNQAAQQVGDYGTAENSAAITQGNSGRKLSGYNYGSQDVAQLGENVAVGNGQANQANVNQAAQQVGDHGTAENSAAVTQEND